MTIGKNCANGEHTHCSGVLKFDGKNGDLTDEVVTCACACHTSRGLRDRPFYPLRLFIYDKAGMHDDGIPIVSESQLNGVGVRLLVQSAIDDGVEIRMTDPDDFLVFHANGGQ